MELGPMDERSRLQVLYWIFKSRMCYERDDDWSASAEVIFTKPRHTAVSQDSSQHLGYRYFDSALFPFIRPTRYHSATAHR